MATTRTPARRTRKTTTRRRTRRLPRLGWWWPVIGIAIYAAARTWPTLTAATVALLGGALILRAIRPRHLAHLWRAVDRINERRRALPAPGRHRSLDTFLTMNPNRFERAIAELALEDPRIHTAHTVGGANDRGADVLLQHTDGRRILIQCKRYRPGNNVGSDTIQTINGVYRDLHHCHEAIIVTTARFTRSAVETNARLPRQIRLIDEAGLIAWANGGPTPWT